MDIDVKKFLQAQADKDDEALLTEGDRLFIQELILKDEVPVKQKETGKKAGKKNRRAKRR